MNIDVRENKIDYVQAIGPTAILCADFRKVDVVYMPNEPHVATCEMDSGYAAAGYNCRQNKAI